MELKQRRRFSVRRDIHLEGHQVLDSNVVRASKYLREYFQACRCTALLGMSLKLQLKLLDLAQKGLRPPSQSQRIESEEGEE